MRAVEMTPAAGYDPQGVARHIGRVQQDRPPQAVFRSYAPRDERVQAIQAAAAKNVTSGDFALIQEEVRRALPPPPSRLTPTLPR
jgi:hypothetical protein